MPKDIVKFLSHEKNAFGVKTESDSAKIWVSPTGDFKLSTSLTNGGTYFAEDNKGGTISKKSLRKLFKKLSSDNSYDGDIFVDDFENVVVKLKDSSGESFKHHIKLNSDPVIEKGKLIVRGNIYDRGEVVDHRRKEMGDSYQKLSSGKYEDISLTFSSFDKKEAKENWRSNQDKYPDESQYVSTSISARLVTAEGVEILPLNFVVGAMDTYALIDESYEFGDGATANFSFTMTPEFTASVNTPHPKWYQAYQYLQPGRYSATLGADLTWDALAYLDPGVGSQGDITLAEQEFEGPSFSFGEFPVTGELNSGMDFSVTAHVDALDPANLTLEATQTVGFDLNASTGGIGITPINTGVQWPSVPTVDDLTGLTVSVDTEPYIEFDLGLGASIPHFGNVNFIEGGPRVSVPMDLIFSTNALDIESSTITADIAVNLDGSVTALPFMGGWDFSIGTVSLFEESIPVLG